MSAEFNKIYLRAVTEEVFNQGKLVVLDHAVGASYVAHDNLSLEPIKGREELKQFFSKLRDAFPDMKMTLDDLIAEDEKVVNRFTCTGTHKGDLMGIPPTGKKVTWNGIGIHHFANGKMIESWIYADVLGILHQLGVSLKLRPHKGNPILGPNRQTGLV